MGEGKQETTEGSVEGRKGEGEEGPRIQIVAAFPGENNNTNNNILQRSNNNNPNIQFVNPLAIHKSPSDNSSNNNNNGSTREENGKPKG